MNEILNEIIKVTIVALIPVFLTLAGKLYARLVTWLDSQVTNEVLNRVLHEAFDVVSFIGQGIRPALEEAARDGKLNDEEKRHLKALATQMLLDRLKDVPKSVIPDIEKRAGEAIEAAVGKWKAQLPDPQKPPESK